MKHHICTGECGGVSKVPCDCQAESCSKHDMPLTECACEDGKHGSVNPVQAPSEDTESN